jgi:4-amino-4-deoxychorismate lyase
MPDTLVNGIAAGRIAVDDRGLNYGDGLFETVAWLGGRPRLWHLHYRRLEEGCARLGLAIPEEPLLRAEMKIVAGDTTAAVIKIILTRGSGGRGYRPPAGAATTRIVRRLDWPRYPEDNQPRGVTLRYCDTRLGRNPRLAGIKHLNRLEQVLARAEWDDEYDEGLMQDESGNVIEGTMSNLFACIEGAIVTPDLSQCGVAGVMRRWVLDTAPRLEMPLRTEAVSTFALDTAQELFITNSLIGIWPVRRLGTREYSVGTVTRRLQDALQRETD